MRPHRQPLVHALALAGILAALLACLAPCCAAPDYPAALRSAANLLDRAAKSRAVIPAAHVPPAPICCGPPRFSPSVDDWLQAALAQARGERSAKNRASDLRSIAAALRSLASQASPGEGAQSLRGDVRHTVDAILAQPAYHVAATAPAPAQQPSLLQRVLDWIMQRIGELFERLATATEHVPLLGNAFAVVLIAIAIAGLAYVAYRIADGLIGRRNAGAYAADSSPIETAAGADELRRAAEDAAARGDHARAIALLFQASLRTLDMRFGIAYDPARTAGEYRRAVDRRAAPVARDFATIARCFTAAAFAGRPAGEPDWMRATSAYAAVAGIATSGATGAAGA